MGEWLKRYLVLYFKRFASSKYFYQPFLGSSPLGFCSHHGLMWSVILLSSCLTSSWLLALVNLNDSTIAALNIPSFALSFIDIIACFCRNTYFWSFTPLKILLITCYKSFTMFGMLQKPFPKSLVKGLF